jgi:DNA-binding SARP family transcriptional activator/ABC-type branched-subunit amino acid transport system substrate-binding protein
MDVCILGPLEVLHDGRPVTLGGGRQRALLALLVVERNHPVSGDRIVEELWNGDAPATAAKVVQNLVSQLRRDLPADDLLRTRGRGYELALPDEALDAARFERLLDEGRRALAADQPERAAATLRAALAVWRGPALGDLGDEPWARTEAARLEEQRLVALERRIDADLALGRHADVVSELEAAVAREPLREGLRARLMLALYRDGRQAEALAAYADARRTLVSDLGIEPGPALTRLHEAILQQDDSLAPPATATRTPPARRRRAGLLVLAGVLLLAVAAAGILLTRDDGAAVLAATGGEIVALDAATGDVERHIPAGRTPSAVAVAGRRVWAVDGDARTLVRVDPASGTVDTLATGATPIDVAAGSGRTWVANGRPREATQTVGPVADEIVGLDPATSRQDAAVPLPAGGTDAEGGHPGQLAVSRGAVWAITADQSVVRIDPAAAEITNTVRGLRAAAVAAGGAGVWVVEVPGRVAELDERTGRILRRKKLPTRDPGAFAVGDDAVWVAGLVEGKLWRVGRGRDAIVGSVDVEAGAAAIAASGSRVWLANPLTGTVTVVDGVAMSVTKRVRVGGAPRALAVDGGTVWVAVTGAEAATTSSTVAGVQALPASMCGPPLAGPGGRADALVVSDLPLSGDERLSATQMSRAITFVLRERGFRAGRLRLAFQSCDDAIAGGNFDEGKCAANGRAYAADADVLGVIGTLNSGCVFRMLPPLNRAQGGPLGIVSPLNSYPGLTRRLDDGDELAQLYPTGRRNFVRIYPADDLQGAALAELARDRGRHRVFMLEDGDPYSLSVADGFAAAAPRLGLEVAGRKTWNQKARNYRRLAERVARSGADAVFVSGLIVTNAGQVIRDLRRRLGTGVDLLAPDGVAPPALLWRAAGPAARGVFVSGGAVPTDQMPPAGAAFVRRFSRTQSGVPVDPFAVYAAHATEVLLDAIARSDGTRGSVIEQLFVTKTPDGLTGPVRFDRRGDTVYGAVTILRVENPATARSLGSVEGAKVERIARVSPELVER